MGPASMARVEIHDVPLSHSLSLHTLSIIPKVIQTTNISTMSSDLKPIHPEVMYAERSSESDPEKVCLFERNLNGING